MQPKASAVPELHDAVDKRLTKAGQRYTSGRRQLVEALAFSEQPMSMVDILSAVPDMPQSSAYRHLTALAACGVATRIASADDLGFFELSEELGTSHHHHHVVCEKCRVVVDVASSAKLEKAMADAAELAAADTGFHIEAHRIDLVGLCPSCRKAQDQALSS